EVRIVDRKRAYVPTSGLDTEEPTGRAWLQLAKAVLTGHPLPGMPATAQGVAAAQGTASGHAVEVAKSPGAGRLKSGGGTEPPRRRATRTAVAGQQQATSATSPPLPASGRKRAAVVRPPALQSPPLAGLRRRGKPKPEAG